MSQVDELEKLSQLREKGVLTEEEFNAKKTELLATGGKPKVKILRRLLWAIPLMIIGVVGLVDAASKLAGTSKPNLQCDSAAAKDTLEKAFDQSQFARTLNLSAVLVSAVKEQGRDPKSGELSCRATLTLNNTQKASVLYKIQPRPGGKFLLSFEVLDDDKTSNVMPASPSAANQGTASPAKEEVVERCMKYFTRKFEDEFGDDAPIGKELLEEWTAQCKK